MKCKKKRYLFLVLGIFLVIWIIFFYCPHNETYTKISKNATCFENGKKDTICKKCNLILESNILEKTNHTFSVYKLEVSVFIKLRLLKYYTLRLRAASDLRFLLTLGFSYLSRFFTSERIPAFWIFFLNLRKALSILSFSPTLTSAIVYSPPL